jgi:hypothetical protein
MTEALAFLAGVIAYPLTGSIIARLRARLNSANRGYD